VNTFKIRPEHWWQWINPFWWRNARRVHKIMEYQWDHGGKEEFEKKYRNAVLYGTSDPEVYK